MRRKIGNSVLELVEGDITREEVDAIVNAANDRLLPGGGVCGAIHRAAGPGLARACAEIGYCPTGQVRVTKGFNLKAEYVFHAVGPIYRERPEDAGLLTSCYREALRLAREMKLRSISFPAISTGIYGYPVREAAKIAIETIVAFLRENSPEMLVRMVLFTPADYDIHCKVLQEVQAG